MSYLGKISALVTVNTGDFAPKLNAAARDVAAFARSVEKNIGSTMRDATASLNGIYTPLQRFERSLRAATSMKLSFNGFAGAIKDIDQLKMRLTSLNQRQIDVILKTSGFKDITAFREAVGGLKSREFDLIAKVGGVEKLKQLRDAIAESSGEFAVTANVKDAGARVEALKQQIKGLRDAGSSTTLVVDPGRVDAAKKSVENATAALRTFLTAASGVQDISPRVFKQETQGRLAQATTELETLQNAQGRRESLLEGVQDRRRFDRISRLNPDQSAAIRAKEEEVATLSGLLTQTQRLQKQAKLAERELNAAEVGARPNNRSAIKEKTRELKQQTAEYQKALAEAQQKINSQLGLNLEKADIEGLISGGASRFDEIVASAEKFEAAMRRIGVSGEQASAVIKRVMQALGSSDNAAAVSRMRQMVSAAEELSKPYEEVRKKVMAAGRGIEAAFGPAMAKTQAGIEAVFGSIERSDDPVRNIRRVERALADVLKQLQLDSIAADQFAEAMSSVGRLKTGRELAFSAPMLASALGRGATIGNSAAGLPATAIAGDPRIAASIAQINEYSNKVTTAFARMRAAQNTGAFNTGFLEKSYDILLAKLTAIQTKAEQRIQLYIDTAEATEAINKVGNAAARAKLQAANASIVGEMAVIASMPDDERRAKEPEIAAREAELASRARMVVGLAGGQVGKEDAEKQAQNELDRRASGLRSVMSQAFRLPPSTTEEVDSFFSRVVADIGKLEASSRGAFQPLVNEIFGLIQAKAPIDDIIAKLQQLEAVSGQASRAEGLIARINRLSPGARPDLLLDAEAIRSAATSPIPLASPPDPDELDRRVAAREAMGLDIEDPQRMSSRLRGSVSSLKGQIEQLPTPLQAQFIPALRAAENEVVRLAGLADPLPEDFERADAATRRLAADLRVASGAAELLAGLGGEGEEGILSGLRAQDIRASIAQLQVLQQEAAKIRNPAQRRAAAAAMQGYRLAMAGDDGSDESRTRVNEARDRAVDAVARPLGQNPRALRRRVERAGDVARGGFDNFSLAINQAAFAIDDFMSSTGGLEFKLRAISNNITQMAFILGGTTGLFVGLGAVIAGQAAVGLIKWINNGRSAEDQTKALNDSLARQKSLVEELAQAFRSLGDSMSQGTFSEGGERGRKFGEQVTDIERKQREQQREAVVGLDPNVIRERAQQNALNRRLGETTDVGQIVAIQEQLRQSRERERVAADNAASRPAPTMEGVRDTLRGSVMRMARAETVDNAMFTPTDGGAQPDALREAMEIRARAEQQAAAIAAPAGVFEARSAIRARITELSETASGSSLVTPAQSAAAKEETRALKLLLGQLEAPARRAADQLAVEVARSAQAAAAEISSAQNDVAEAIRRGVPAALGFQVELDRLASELVAANASLAAAQQLENADEKVAAVNRAEARIAEVRGQRENVIQIGRQARLGRGFGGERLTSAISAIQGNERFRNQQSGLIAQARGTADNELVARQRLANASSDVAAEDQRLRAARERRDQAVAAGRPGDAREAEADIAKAEAAKAAAVATRDAASADVEAAQKASDLAASILEFALSVEQAISRIRKIGDAAIQTSERGADSAQQAYQDNPFRAGAMESRDAAERRLIEDRAVVERAQNAVSRARDEAMATPEMQQLRQERETLESSIKDREAAVAQGTNQPQDARALEAERNRLVEIQRQEEQAMQQATAARRKELDAINSNIAAREKELERSRQRDAEDPTTNRQRRRIDAAMSTAEQRADEAQQRYMANPTEENRLRRNGAEADLRSSRAESQKLQDDLDRRRQEIEQNNPQLRAAREEAAAAARERASIRETAEKEGRGLTEDDRKNIAALDAKEADARARAEAEVARGTRDQQFAVDRFNRLQVRRVQADRGRLLGMTERDRFREEFQLGAGADIRAEAARLTYLRDVRGVKTADPQAFMGRAIAEQAKTVAPMLEEFRMERETAMLQGPSRAALQVSDVTTTQGQAELNRLLRGDDSAKDVNLAELREQSAKLQILIDVIRNNPLPVWEAG